MELELHQLELRYAHLRKRHPARERQLLGSLAEIGQQLPIVVVGQADRFIVIDGYKRVRALKRLAFDTVSGTDWELTEAEALLLERGLRVASEDAFDQAWLLKELQERFGFSEGELAQRLGRHKSWVSRRLALLEVLPPSIQDQVRAGTLGAHAAMKYLVPLARANAPAARELAAAIEPLRPTSRQVAALYTGWQSGSTRTRELILSSPQTYLQALQQQATTPPSPLQRWLADLGALGGIARRAYRPLQEGLWLQLLSGERAEAMETFARTRMDLERLLNRFDRECAHAG